MKKIEILGIVIFFGFLLWAIIERNVEQSDLRTHGVLVNAKINDVIIRKNGLDGGFKCSFEYMGTIHETTTPTTYQGNRYALIGKFFPGMFSAKTETLEILITMEDFEKYNIPYPDSLRFVLHDESK